MSSRAASASPVLHALLERVVDYAGLFPPAGLSMHDAVAEYAVQRRAPESWMLGRFVVPIARLDELASARDALRDADGGWPLSALVSADPAGDAEAIGDFNATHAGRLEVASVELRAATPDAIDWALAQMDQTLERYVEIPLEDDPRPLLQAIQRHGGRAKARTGGVTPEAIPAPAALARFIVRCAELDVPFKATAGLHHPLRGEQRLTYDADAPSATTFGFLGVFLAGALARAGADEGTVLQLLEERDAHAFTFSDSTVRWRDWVLDVDRISSARHGFALSFGSCSFREPVEDLHQMSIL